VTGSGHTEYAPAAIQRLFDRLVATHPNHRLELGGIVGDASHTYGYHRARAVLPDTDYSVQLPRDRQGDPWAASALDVTPKDPIVMQRLTSRLARAVARRDPRLTRCVREFYGTLDGRNVYGYDLAEGRPQSSDASHLHHLHLSFYRDTTQRPRLLDGVAVVLAGTTQRGSGG
jgi:hypothetical protein